MDYVVRFERSFGEYGQKQNHLSAMRAESLIQAEGEISQTEKK